MLKAINIFVLFLALATYSYGQKRAEKSVRKTFENYKSAILNDKGEEAVRYVDSKTIQYYGDMLDLVKNADSAQVNSLSILDKLLVFSIRHRTSRENILSFDGKSLLVYAIKSGMVGKNSVANNSIGEISIDQDFATGQLISNGQKAPLYFHFYKEAGQWKLNLTSIISVSNVAFKSMVDNSGKGENEYLFFLLENLTGKKPGREIWEKVK